MQIPIIVVGDASGRYISGIESQRGAVSVVRHVHDLGEMLGIAQSGIARAVLLVTQYEDLTRSMLSALTDLDLAVCAVVDSDANLPFSEIFTIDSLAGIPEVLQGLEEAVESSASRSTGEGALPATTAIPAQEKSIPDTGASGSSEREERSSLPPARDGKILTVWGAQGSPGRTTLAVSLAGLAADTGAKVCLVDADTYGASVGAVLGLADDYSSLAQLCHYADRGNLTAETVEELVSTIKHRAHRLDVISGINRADRWTEIRGKALAQVFERLRGLYDLIIVDTSFCIEQDEAVAFDGLAPLRNDGTLTSIFEADHILVVGAADVVGVPRAVKALDSLKTLLADTMIEVPRSVFFNRVRADAVGASPTVALEHAWERFGPAELITGFIAEDRVTADKAWLTGKTVIEVAPKSKLALDLSRVFSQVVLPLGALPAPEGDGGSLESAGGGADMVEKKGRGFLAQLRGR